MGALGLGLGLGACAPVLTAQTPGIRVRAGGSLPVPITLIAGQTGADLPVAWFDPANYDAPGTVSVALLVNGAPLALTAELAASDIVTLQVSDDADTPPLTIFLANVVPMLGLTGLLNDLNVVLGAGPATYPAAPGFIGTGLSFTLVAAPPGVTIDTATGVIDLSGLTDPVVGAPITVRATDSALQSVADSFLLTAVLAQISAGLPPQMSPLYEGQALRDVAGFAAMTALANFSSNAGNIVSVDVAPTGDAATPLAPLLEDQIAGFVVTATDAAGATATFESDLLTVLYRARILSTASNEAAIDINPLVPDNESVSLTISGGTGYDGSYTALAGTFRNALYNFPGTVRIGFAGAVTDLAPGDVLTADDGLWTTPTGTLVLSRQWLRNGAEITDATGLSYTLTPADEGAEISLRLVADNGAQSAVVTDAAAVSVPGPTPSVAGTLVGTGLVLGTGRTTAHDVSGVAAGDTVYILAQARSNANSVTIVDIQINGETATPVIASPGSGGQVSAAIYKFTRTTETVIDIDVVTSSGNVQNSAVALYAVSGASTETTAAAAGSTLSLDVTLDVAGNGLVLAIGTNKGGGGADSVDFIAGGLTEMGQLTYNTNLDVIIGTLVPAASQAGRLFTLGSASGTPATALSVVAIS